jgi:hypothetical protein
VIRTFVTRAASSSDQFLQVFGVPGSLHRDRRGRALDLTKVLGREVKVGGAEVFLEALELSGTGDGNNPRLLGEEPRE